MKKLISILLVAMLIIGMFPATALTAFAEETTETISFTSTAQRKSQTAASQVWENGNLRFTNNKGSSSSSVANYSNPVRIYGKSEMILECTNGANITTIAFKTNTGSDYVASLKTTLEACDGTYTVSGDTYTLTLENPTPTFTFTNAATKQIRLYSITVTCEAGGSTEPACDHVGFDTYEGDDAVEGSCTVDSKTATIYCSNCDGIVTESQTTTAPGHDYGEDGICSVCGEEKPAGYVLVTDVSSLKANDKVIITSQKGSKTYAMSNDNGTGKAPAGVVVTVDNGVIVEAASNLVWNVSYSNGNLTFYPDGVTDKWLYCTSTNNGVRVGTNANKTFTIDATSGYLKHTGTSRYLGVYEATPDWRCYTSYTTANIANQTLAFYAQSTGGTCDHSLTVTIPKVPATCTTAGTEEIKKCACGEKVEGGAEIPALDHSYTDDACIRCGVINPDAANKAELMTALPKDGDVIIIYHVKEKVLMASTASGNRMDIAAVTASGTQMPYSATAVSLLTVEIDEDGNYLFLSADGKYMTSGDTGNSLTFVDEATEYSLWEIEQLEEDNKVYIHSVNAKYNEKVQTLEVYQNTFYPYTFNSDYSSSYEMQLYLVEAAAEETPVVEMGGKEYSSFEKAYAEDPDELITLLAPIDDIDVTGDLYLDLNGYAASVVNANGIYACDSSATVTTKGNGVLTVENTTDKVITDNTVDGVRYIALKGENNQYTFHVLELNLTKVTLRTGAAGIYYKAEMKCDDQLRAATDYHGMVLSLKNMPGADFATENDGNCWTKIANAPASNEEFTSCSVFNIFVGGDEDAVRGATKIYANAYLQLKGTGEIIMADTANMDKTVGTGFNGAACSLKDVMVALNTSFTTMTDEAKKASIVQFYKDWSEAMSGWGLTNIAAAATPAQ